MSSTMAAAKWPMIRVEYHGPHPSRIITLEQAARTYGLDEREVGWLERGEIAGTSVKGHGSVNMLHRYTLADSIRDAAPELLSALKATLHLSLEMKGTKNLSQSELAAIETAKASIRKAEGE